jgi:predicted PurR-regulated permease PerM
LKRLRPVIVLGLAALIVWQLASVILVFFAAVVFATLLRSLSDPIQRYSRAPGAVSVGVAVALIALLIVGSAWLFGTQIAAQADVIFQRAPESWNWLRAHLAATPVGRYVAAHLDQDGALWGQGLFSHVGAFANTGAGVAANLGLALVSGVYLALDPELYRRGLLWLTPERHRPLIVRGLGESGRALKLWMLGQLIAMGLIAALTTLGLALIQSPSWFALGLFAGATEFIPIVGPFLGAVPALLTALSVGPRQVLLTAGLFIVIQQLEGNAIQPLIQRRMVAVPPVVGLFALAAMASLFGVLGMILAAPHTVLVIVWMKLLRPQDLAAGGPDAPSRAG